MTRFLIDQTVIIGMRHSISFGANGRNRNVCLATIIAVPRLCKKLTR